MPLFGKKKLILGMHRQEQKLTKELAAIQKHHEQLGQAKDTALWKPDKNAEELKMADEKSASTGEATKGFNKNYVRLEKGTG